MQTNKVLLDILRDNKLHNFILSDKMFAKQLVTVFLLNTVLSILYS